MIFYKWVSTIGSIYSYLNKDISTLSSGWCVDINFIGSVNLGQLKADTITATSPWYRWNLSDRSRKYWKKIKPQICSRFILKSKLNQQQYKKWTHNFFPRQRRPKRLWQQEKLLQLYFGILIELSWSTTYLEKGKIIYFFLQQTQKKLLSDQDNPISPSDYYRIISFILTKKLNVHEISEIVYYIYITTRFRFTRLNKSHKSINIKDTNIKRQLTWVTVKASES